MSWTTKKWISLALTIVSVLFLFAWKTTEQGWFVFFGLVFLVAGAALNNFGLCPYCCRPLGRHFGFIEYCPHCGHEL